MYPSYNFYLFNSSNFKLELPLIIHAITKPFNELDKNIVD